ncbi:MAG: hypothetical protein KDD43_07055 [Bdellovibrionales bacterium]|nr:hypothetical protein [Bdellovibrionales bacterium]
MSGFRNGLFLLAAVLVSIFFHETSEAASRRKSILNVNSHYTSYSDLKLSGGEEVLLEPSLAVELDFRVSGPFSLILGGSQAVDSLRTDYGLGIRVDVPGFFLLGGSARDLRRAAKNYPVNTSIYYISSVTTVRAANAPDVKSVTGTYGFTIDIFLFNNVAYWTNHISVYTLQGNSFLALGSGLGAQF